MICSVLHIVALFRMKIFSSLKWEVRMEHLGHKIKRIDQLFKIRMNCNLEQLGITISQMHILLYLIKNHGEKMNQKKLSEQFGVKHSTMSGILARLKEKGFIEICVDEDNKKYKNIYPTAKAMLLDEQMALHRNETESLLQKGFSKEEIQQLGNYLDRLYHNLLSGSEISDKEIHCFNRKISTIERRHNND